MNIHALLQQAGKPAPFAAGTDFMWTDPHISEQLLRLHLDPESDTASRKAETIENLVTWILSGLPGENLRILDLGCGPGLYAEAFARRGHRVTGVDISARSIDYAREQTRKNRSEIRYLCRNYLELDFLEEFDLAVLIYLDFCVLRPAERTKLLETVRRALKPGGVLLWDGVNSRNLDSKILPESWEASDTGFWSPEPYLVLNRGYHYPEVRALLNQHVVLDPKDRIRTFLFWSLYYEYEDLLPITEAAGFSGLKVHRQVLPGDHPFAGENIDFYTVRK